LADVLNGHRKLKLSS